MMLLSKDQIEEVRYLEIRGNPEYRDLRLLEKKDAGRTGLWFSLKPN